MKKIKLNYNNFINDYLHDVDKAIEETVKVQKKKIVSLVEKIKKVKKNKKKVLIFGNGGSAATASHFSVDLTKNAKLRCLILMKLASLLALLMTMVLSIGLKKL